MSAKKSNFYCDSAVLEKEWIKWVDSGDDGAWESLSLMIYEICERIARRFNAYDDDERSEIAHDAFIITIGKIVDGKLIFKPERGTGFNLVTTAVIRHIQSRKHREGATKRVYERYKERQINRSDEAMVLRSLRRRSPTKT